MSVTFIGTTFPKSYQWHQYEIDLIQNIQNQIELRYANFENLFINTTWFGPQFCNGEYQKLQQLIAQNKTFDNVFLLSAPDAIALNQNQILKLVIDVRAENYFLLGNFDSAYNFNFICTVLPIYFKKYKKSHLSMTDPKWIYINYNRKPRNHRVKLVDELFQHNLQDIGVITLGKDNSTYNQTGILPQEINLKELPNSSNWGMSMEFGIPHDIHTLGNMDLWQQHFLTVVSETEFFPWDHTFVTEKTWKPIIGMRPFVINGQTKIYSWLRHYGFRTFNHHWPQIKMENLNELEVHNSIISLIKYLHTLSQQDIKKMYQDMIPDLEHNHKRFFQFAQEQKKRIDNLFV